MIDEEAKFMTPTDQTIDCPCKREKCKRHGNCAACREHHKERNKLPACERLEKKIERKNRRKQGRI